MSSLTTPVDVDPLETAEWLDSLASVLDRDGPERAHFILQQMLREAGTPAPICPTPRTHRTSTPSRRPVRRTHNIRLSSGAFDR